MGADIIFDSSPGGIALGAGFVPERATIIGCNSDSHIISRNIAGFRYSRWSALATGVAASPVASAVGMRRS